MSQPQLRADNGGFVAALLVVSLLSPSYGPSLGPRGDRHEFGRLLRYGKLLRVWSQTTRDLRNCKLARREAMRDAICPIITGVRDHKVGILRRVAPPDDEHDPLICKPLKEI